MEIAIIFCIAIIFGVAEFFGRKKHIGRWWTLSLLISNLLFGVIALIVSPSVKEKPTSGGQKHKIFGWICIIFGVLNLIKINPLALGFFVLGVYLIQLSKGKVINTKPKDYFQKEITLGFNFKKINLPLNNHYYFLMIDGEQSDAFTFEELKNKRLKKNDLVWRKGYNDWVLASEIEELSSIIVPTPPLFNRKQTPPPFKKNLL